MTVEELKKALELTPFSEADPDREVTGGYTGDLLSWVMGRANSGDAWVTIMSNRNIAAVAALTDVAAIVLAEGVQPDEGVTELCEAKGINLYGSALPSFTLSARIAELLS